MGADEFIIQQSGKSAKEAFACAVEDARYEHGHGGYTGTIAEKSSFRMVSLPKDEDAYSYAESLLDDDNHWVSDKWGPAGCILVEENEDGNNLYLFFGWASS